MQIEAMATMAAATLARAIVLVVPLVETITRVLVVVVTMVAIRMKLVVATMVLLNVVLMGTDAPSEISL